MLTLWGAIVAERLGYEWPTALTLGKVVAGLNAQSKGRRLGIYPGKSPEGATERATKPSPPVAGRVALLGREVPTVKTPDGLRALAKERAESPAGVERYLEQKFGDALPEVVSAMRALARAYKPDRLAAVGFALYEQFRPEIPRGVTGWGAKGRLDLDRIRELRPGA